MKEEALEPELVFQTSPDCNNNYLNTLIMKEELELEPGVVQNPGDSDPLFDNQASSLPDEIKNEEECVQAASTRCRHNCLDYNGEAASLSLSSLLLANHCLQARRAAAAEECRRQSPILPMSKNPKNPRGSKKEFLKWTALMDDVFIQALLHQQHVGNMIDGTLKTTAYSNMVTELSEKFCMDLNKSHLKNRLKTVKNCFNECHELFKNRLSNFAWSPVTKMWTAEPEVWGALIEANPKAQKWKTRSINNYESLAELFAKDRAMGEGAKPAKEKRERWAASTCGNDSETVHGIEGAKPAKEKRERWAASTCGNDSETVHGIDQLLSQNEVIYESFDDLDDGVGMMSKEPPSRTPGQSATTSKGKKRKLSNDVDDVIEVLRGALDNVVEAIREGNSIIEKGRPRVYSGEEIFNELVTLGLEPHLLDDSYLFLMQNPVKSRAFFGCPFDRRKRILEKMMSRFDGH